SAFPAETIFSLILIMGILIISQEQCIHKYKISINCSTVPPISNETKLYTSVGGLTPGQFDGDAAIAGIGVSNKWTRSFKIQSNTAIVGNSRFLRCLLHR